MTYVTDCWKLKGLKPILNLWASNNLCDWVSVKKEKKEREMQPYLFPKDQPGDWLLVIFRLVSGIL